MHTVQENIITYYSYICTVKRAGVRTPFRATAALVEMSPKRSVMTLGTHVNIGEGKEIVALIRDTSEWPIISTFHHV